MTTTVEMKHVSGARQSLTVGKNSFLPNAEGIITVPEHLIAAAANHGFEIAEPVSPPPAPVKKIEEPTDLKKSEPTIEPPAPEAEKATPEEEEKAPVEGEGQQTGGDAA